MGSAEWAANPLGQSASNTFTPLFVCGEDQKVQALVPVTWAHVALAADGRLFSPCPAGPHAPDHREMRERRVIEDALRVGNNAELRRMAVRSLGRVGLAGSGLADSDAAVRREAANALGELAPGAEVFSPFGGPAAQPGRRTARAMLEARLPVEKDPDVAGALLESLGRMAHPDNATRDEVETLLVDQATGPSARILGAVKGLEALIRQNPRRSIGDKTRQRLRALVFIGPRTAAGPTTAGTGSAPAPGDEANWTRTRRLALAALNTALDDDAPTLSRAAFDADWQVRRLVAMRMNLAVPELATTVAVLSKDLAFQVRYELLAAVARQATATKACAPLVTSFHDPNLTVALRAIDLLPAECQDKADAVAVLGKWVEDLTHPDGATRWHRPSHALAVLARVEPAAARPLLEHAVRHGVWQVRAMAASAAGAMRDEATVVGLAGDRHPNVRNAALEALSRMKSPAVTASAIEALKSDDYQLLRTAARVLSGTPSSMRDEAAGALLLALRRLTDAATDTSRDPRVAILERLREVLSPDRAALLQAFADDFDPVVRGAVVKTFGALLPGAVPSGEPKHRYPYQPPAEAVLGSPGRATIVTADGAIELELLVRQAPVTVARFLELARAGYYNGLTFHRVVPNFVIQGGSPGANEYVGVARYMRDETGTAPHVRGAVGISTRGRDTGDGQIFINLVDNPRLDHQYTVFAQVTMGFDVLDGVLEGTTIQAVTVK
jgi:cyclophilin family peptidyl-prolyl cis-trans isomerase/HEAT repeat protein